MLKAILLYLVVLFILEVLFGSNTGAYNAEIGYQASSGQETRLSPKQFFLELLPVALLCTGGVFYLLQSL